jgi:hypothetical protein
MIFCLLPAGVMLIAQSLDPTILPQSPGLPATLAGMEGLLPRGKDALADGVTLVIHVKAQSAKSLLHLQHFELASACKYKIQGAWPRTIRGLDWRRRHRPVNLKRCHRSLNCPAASGYKLSRRGPSRYGLKVTLFGTPVPFTRSNAPHGPFLTSPPMHTRHARNRALRPAYCATCVRTGEIGSSLNTRAQGETVLLQSSQYEVGEKRCG